MTSFWKCNKCDTTFIQYDTDGIPVMCPVCLSRQIYKQRWKVSALTNIGDKE